MSYSTGNLFCTKHQYFFRTARRYEAHLWQSADHVKCIQCKCGFDGQVDWIGHYWFSEKHPKCLPCQKGFHSSQHLQVHYWHSNRHTKCKSCRRGFEDEKTLQDHHQKSEKHLEEKNIDNNNEACDLVPDETSAKKPHNHHAHSPKHADFLQRSSGSTTVKPEKHSKTSTRQKDTYCDRCKVQCSDQRAFILHKVQNPGRHHLCTKCCPDYETEEELFRHCQTSEAHQTQTPHQTVEAYQKPEAHHNPEAHETPELHQNPQTHQSPEAHQTPTSHQTVEAYQNSEAHRNPEAHQIPEIHQTPQARQSPEADQTPEIHQTSEAHHLIEIADMDNDRLPKPLVARKKESLCCFSGCDDGRRFDSVSSVVQHLESEKCTKGWTIQQVNDIAVEYADMFNFLSVRYVPWFLAGLPRKTVEDSDLIRGKWKCSFCKSSHPSRSELEHHIKDEISDTAYPQLLRCNACQVGFTTLSGLISHTEGGSGWSCPKAATIAGIVSYLKTRVVENSGYPPPLHEVYELRFDPSRKDSLVVKVSMNSIKKSKGTTSNDMAHID